MKNFVPFEAVSYDHAAALLGVTPWEMSRDSDLLARGHQLVIEAYRLNHCVVAVDLYNIEAEAYGLEIAKPAGNGMPSPTHPGWDDVSMLANLQLDFNRGRIPLLLQAASQLQAACPAVRVGLPMAGPFTIACHFLGLENMVCELFSEPEDTVAAMQTIVANQILLGQEYERQGFSVSIFESSVTPPLLSPDLFIDHIAPLLTEIVTALSGPVQLIIGGNTLPILQPMVDTGADYLICPVETNQEAFLQALAGNLKPAVRVNMDPSVFLPGRLQDALREKERVMSLVERFGAATIGALLPFEADPDIVRAVSV